MHLAIIVHNQPDDRQIASPRPQRFADPRRRQAPGEFFAGQSNPDEQRAAEITHAGLGKAILVAAQ